MKIEKSESLERRPEDILIETMRSFGFEDINDGQKLSKNSIYLTARHPQAGLESVAGVRVSIVGFAEGPITVSLMDGNFKRFHPTNAPFGGKNMVTVQGVENLNILLKNLKDGKFAQGHSNIN